MISAFFKFARIRILISCFALCFLGALSAGSLTLTFPINLLLLTIWIVHANSINDYTDLAIDKLNLATASDRPLVSGEISLWQFWQLHVICTLLIFLISSFLGIQALLLSLFIVCIDYLYSIKPVRLTDRPILSPIVLAFAYVFFSFNIGFFTNHPLKEYPILLVAGIITAFTARMLLKDYRDVIGDKKYGKRTFLLSFGSRITCLVSGFLWILAGLIILLALPHSTSLIVILLLGLAQVVTLLYFLSKASQKTIQLLLITRIANAANFLIIAISIKVAAETVYLMTWKQTEFAILLITLPLLLSNAWKIYLMRDKFHLNREKENKITEGFY